MNKPILSNDKALEWAAHIREIRSSGKPVAQWCREHNLSARSYYYWDKRLREKPELVSQSSDVFYQVPFEPSVPQNSHAVQPEETSSLPVTVVQYASYNVLVTDHTSEETLARVLRVIRDA